MDLGPHGFFILAAYALTALVIAGLILAAVLDHRTQRVALTDLEARGARRRSEAAVPVDRREPTAAARPSARW